MAEMVRRSSVPSSAGRFPSAQYEAVLIDEGHDFKPEWLKLVVQMVDPRRNSLLVLYDDAQSIYEAGRQKNFSFKSVGIQAQGRTTILKVNYQQHAGDPRVRRAVRRRAAECDGRRRRRQSPDLMPISAGAPRQCADSGEIADAQAEGEWIAERLKEEHAKARALARNGNPVSALRS
jgi:superfamily I DNA/RNA helicase